MKLSEFQNALDEAKAWRKIELTHARSLAESAGGEIVEAYLCRAWTLLMYAHCDQFLKETSKLYLNYLRENPRDSYDYLSIWKAYRSKDIMLLSNTNNYLQCRAPEDIQKTALINIIGSNDVMEKGNFKYERLRFFCDWILQIDFDHLSYRPFCTTLKDKRDQIAHGERTYVSRVDDCINWHEPTVQLIDELGDAVTARAIEHELVAPA
jgi:hypothetical protein